MRGHAPNGPSMNPSAQKLLIVEEELSIAAALSRRLRARGYGVEVTPSANAALRLHASWRPDLVIISLTLSGGQGPIVCAEIRKQPQGDLVPIFFLGTGREEISSVSDALSVGADHYFQKPQQISALFKQIHTFIGPAGVLAGADPPASQAPQRAWPQTPDGSVDEHTPGSMGMGSMGMGSMGMGSVNEHGMGSVSMGSVSMGSVNEHPPGSMSAPPPLIQPAWDTGVEPQAQPQQGAVRPSPEGSPQGAQRRDTQPHAVAWSPAFEPPSPPREGPQHWLRALELGRAVPIEIREIGPLLVMIEAAGLTGRVELSSAGIMRRVFFEAGRPIFADSSAASEDLSHFLAAEGYISRVVLEEAAARARALGKSTEDVLIEAGFLKSSVLYQALRPHVLARVLALFGLEAGEAVVLQGGGRPLDPVDLNTPLSRLILDGVRRKYGRLRLYRAFGALSAIPKRVTSPAPPLSDLRPDEQALLAAVDGQRAVAELARVTRLGEVDALAILYGLSILGRLELPSSRPIATLPPLGPEAIERVSGPRTADQMPGYADLVSRKWAEAQSLDYFRILEVGVDASEAELRAAWETLKARFDPHRVRREGPLWSQVKEIADVLDDAFALLSHPQRRARYAQAAGLAGRGA
ncbi:response regulator [Myxococcota bacterium]|nr:response regulator [Myxococcota bacterium]MBU1900288.1 response regulator [Myxococcota bacterium]